MLNGGREGLIVITQPLHKLKLHIVNFMQIKKQTQAKKDIGLQQKIPETVS